MKNALGNLWEAWKRFARRVADFQARLILTFFYYFFFAPFAMIVRWFSDPLEIKGQRVPGWHARGKPEDSSLDRAMRQY